MTPKQRPVHVVLCGERSRGDDGAAFAALSHVPAGVLALAVVHATGSPDPAVLAGVPTEAACVVADAVQGVAPGRVLTLPLDHTGTDRGRLRSTHTLPLAESLALAAEVRGAPLRGSIVGIGIAGTGLGDDLSPAVQDALPAFAAALAHEILHHADS